MCISGFRFIISQFLLIFPNVWQTAAESEERVPCSPASFPFSPQDPGAVKHRTAQIASRSHPAAPARLPAGWPWQAPGWVFGGA